MRNFGRLLRYALRHKARLCLAFALSLLGIVFELARPWPIKVVVDYVLQAGRPLPPWLAASSAYLPGAQTTQGLLIWSVIVAVVIAVGGAALSILVMKTTVSVAQTLVHDLSRDLFGKLQRLSLSYYGRHQVGDLLQRMSGDVFVVYLAFAQVTLPIVISLLSLVGMFVIMASLDMTLALIALTVVPLLALSLVLFAKPMQKTTARQYETQGALSAFVQQSLSAMKVIQGFAREQYVQGKMDARAREFGDAFNVATVVGTGYKQITTLITGAAAAVLLGLGALRVMDGRLSVGDLFVFLGYLAALYGPVNSLSTAVAGAVAVATRGRRVFEILDSEEVIPERTHPISLGRRARGEVVFENVTFGYETVSRADGNGAAMAAAANGKKRIDATKKVDEQAKANGHSARAILRNVSFRARPGQITAIVGATGAGKTSLVSLLSRFYDPWEGRVLVDGHDVRELSLASLRENVSLVLQEPFLFPMSVADNIAFACPDSSREEIIRVAKAAHAHEFIERLPQGYDTVISEKGDSLSGGERQRIAIARAVLKDAPILILDEPTSALDAHTEAKIFEALSQLMKDRTTFIISHRLSTIRRADQILALEGGYVVERGTHESLLAHDNVYANLYRHQHIAAL